MHDYVSECHAKGLICYFHGQGHCMSSYDQNMTLSAILSDTVDSLATKLGLKIHHQKPECPVKKIGLLISGSKSQQRIKMLMFFQMN